ncbi:MAG: FAD-binding oxidoreductase, partial [Pseudomonadota bacterium]
MDRTSLLQSLREKCGERDVVTDQADLEFFASDLYERGVTPCAVVRPRRVDQVQDIVRIARQQGCAIYLRGGGRSYSNAFLPQTEHALLVDSTGLDEIHKIDAENLFVTVGVGLTWARLDEALKPHGLRAVFWGPASGLNATIGGSMSQGTANNSSAKNGTSSDAVLSYEIVTGRGDLLTTGLDAQEQGLPNFRPYGPDLTGLFNADAGALGIKTAVTLKLEARPSALGGVSFAFESHANMVKGMRAATALGLSAAIIAMDADTADIRSGETGLKADLQKLLAIMRTAHNPLRGLVRGIKIALAGRRVFEQAKYTGHFLAEAPSEAVLRASERALRQAVASHGD